ncbi:preprotein translocase subunit SecA [Rickettsiales endosymbiont of Stachyamoeba lipophora]|uniref:preprotein translocase subunit SecA n=1 Tax=Rickettsiales endosymbiont of Stachyamoeba lipophora TaxID=2486578 RepID=UPI000F652F98|nr:preprotein translocase subunit SecA [Rickettsiales endosymbiont of Stachyamoeba lipophora]AZL15920.1 preprotein translocase subunit SecA [Rickettsiales endosymbiont of Stachyamoeba lipophora]
MLKFIGNKIFGTANQRYLTTLKPILNQINEFEPQISQLSDEELQAKTNYFKELLAKGSSLDDILPESFAVVREASKRVLGQRHYDEQLIGGRVLHHGNIAEMRTGEGKTLVATLPAYLNALSGKGVHVVTVNDYLAKRDAEWMGKIYRFLGLSVGCITNQVSDRERKEAYQCDITYGTNNEFGFDYLRDNMRYNLADMVQRDLNFAIIDEVDSILIDEARTPLIISGPSDDKSDLYLKVDKLMKHITPEHYDMDEKNKTLYLNDEGMNVVEELLLQEGIIDSNLYDDINIHVLGHINQALRAHFIMKKDVDYIVRSHKVMIVDEFTGRVLDGRRYSEGLHQALEAKENVPIQNENQTLASITFQNYFRLYNKISGMTGTAMTEAPEFKEIYNLSVYEIPTHLPVKRQDEDDEVYRTEKEKFNAIIKLVEARHKANQPILIGTTSIEKSETLSELLKKANVKHQVLNAKYHEQEAQIIAQAGRKGAVMIATNMAGRGTDIVLGGNLEKLLLETTQNISDPNKVNEITAQIKEQHALEKQEVMDAGGLLVIGTERHESRRVDNQLRGRSGRQGDPGYTKFFLSLEDDLMRIFGTERLSATMLRLGMEEGVALSHPWVTKALQKAQFKVEARNYDIRKNLLKYDDVMNQQRHIIYDQRMEFINSENLEDSFLEQLHDVITLLVNEHTSAKKLPEFWDLEGLVHRLNKIFNKEYTEEQILELADLTPDSLINYLYTELKQYFDEQVSQYGQEVVIFAIKRFFLLNLDHLWKEHLLALDHLRQGIGLRAYGQKDPLNEYKVESFRMFKALLEMWKITVMERFYRMKISFQEPEETKVITQIASVTSEKTGRNSPCGCGSGKKYKYCCGKVMA